MQQKAMGELSSLMRDLEWTRQQLEGIKAEQFKKYVQIAESSEKTKLSILEHMQDILNQVEAEDMQLRDQLCCIKEFNNLAFQEGVADIISLAQEIFRMSSQLKKALDTSNHSEAMVRKLEEKVSNIFRNRNSIIVKMRMAYFSPYSLPLHTLGKIHSVEQSLSFSSSRPSKNDPASGVKEVALTDGKTQWENIESSVHPENNNIMMPSFTYDYRRLDKVREALDESQSPASPADTVGSTCTYLLESDVKEETREIACPTYQFFQSTAKDGKKALPDISSSVGKCKIQAKQQLLASKNLLQAGYCPQNYVTGVSNQSLQHDLYRKPTLNTSLMPHIEIPPRLTKELSEPLKSSFIEESYSMSSSSSSTPSDPSPEVQVCEHFGQKWKKNGKVPHPSSYKGLSRSEFSFMQDLTEGGTTTRLVKQIGKFGSGRAGLNLPYGIHASDMGLLYIIDNGNHRLQVMDTKGKFHQQIPLRAQKYFDVAVNKLGLIALTNTTTRIVEVYNRYGRFLQTIYINLGAPRGITVDQHGEFIVADMKLGVLWAFTLDSSTADLKKSTSISGFNNPYHLNTNSQGLLVLSERGYNGPGCVKVLSEKWKVLKVLGLQDNPVPILHNPRGVCIDNEGGVLVADCGKTHCIVYYPPTKPARYIITEGLCGPRGLALWQDHLLVVADSMNHCIKIFHYQ